MSSILSRIVKGRLEQIRGNPLQMLGFQVTHKRRFMAEMLGGPDEELGCNSVPMSVAMMIAELRLTDTREFFLWADDASFSVRRTDGSHAAGQVVLVDRGDCVAIDFHPVYERGWNEERYLWHGTAEVDADGKLRIPAASDWAWAVYPPSDTMVTLREHQGEVDLICFNRVSAIREDSYWPPVFIGSLEDMRHDQNDTDAGAEEEW